jgi:SAM-dependent methyltransferase
MERQKMSLINSLFNKFSMTARERRATIFRSTFSLDGNTRILDLGSGNGQNIHSILSGQPVQPKNVYIADINSRKVNNGHKKYGFTPVVIGESGALPFDDGFFDIVFCSSVIEHVTIPKEKVWRLYSGSKFRHDSFKRQREFAEEIRRLGKQYFVQTPYKYFPIESHSWLPFVGWFPRWMLVLTLRFTNMFWVKKSGPDWYLLNKKEMSALFQGAQIIYEKSFGMTKSIMAINSCSRPAEAQPRLKLVDSEGDLTSLPPRYS